MNDRIRKLADQAGFAFWEHESWNPGDVIDWSSQYDDELVNLVKLIVKDCALTAGLMEQQGRKNIGAQLLDNFGVK